jgi:acyl-CoA reductase-like NAD-dependent aldehyde dehydrogenase
MQAGKSHIVLSDADVALASQKARESRYNSSGQSCNSAKRFIVASEVAKEFTERYVELTRALVVGDPMDASTEIGPLANRQQTVALDEQVNDAVSKGAKLEYRMELPSRKGYFYPPTVLSGIKKNMKVASEEVFGPVSSIFEVKSEREAIKVANSTSYGLGASVWTGDSEKGEQIARQLEAGIVGVNGVVRSDPRLPFGGVKQSGIGRELSRYGLLEFANIKPIIVK